MRKNKNVLFSKSQNLTPLIYLIFTAPPPEILKAKQHVVLP